MTDRENLEAVLQHFSGDRTMEPCWQCDGLGGVPRVGGVLEICPACLGTGERSQAIGVEVRHPEDEPHQILIDGD